MTTAGAHGSLKSLRASQCVVNFFYGDNLNTPFFYAEIVQRPRNKGHSPDHRVLFTLANAYMVIALLSVCSDITSHYSFKRSVTDWLSLVLFGFTWQLINTMEANYLVLGSNVCFFLS